MAMAEPTPPPRDQIAIHKLDVARQRCRELLLKELDAGQYDRAEHFLRKHQAYEEGILVLLAPDESYSVP
jgi:hypothetical protein